MAAKPPDGAKRRHENADLWSAQAGSAETPASRATRLRGDPRRPAVPRLARGPPLSSTFRRSSACSRTRRVIPTPGNTQQSAPSHPQHGPVRMHQRYLPTMSLERTTAAFFKKAFSRFNRRFSRSNCFNSSRWPSSPRPSAIRVHHPAPDRSRTRLTGANQKRHHPFRYSAVYRRDLLCATGTMTSVLPGQLHSGRHSPAKRGERRNADRAEARPGTGTPPPGMGTVPRRELSRCLAIRDSARLRRAVPTGGRRSKPTRHGADRRSLAGSAIRMVGVPVKPALSHNRLEVGVPYPTPRHAGQCPRFTCNRRPRHQVAVPWGALRAVSIGNTG